MADDYKELIPIQIITAPRLLDEDVNRGARYVLGYLKAVYQSDVDVTVTLFVARKSTMEYESVDTFVLSKDVKRFKRKIKQIGSILNYYLQVDLEGTDFEITSLTVNRKLFSVGRL